MPHKLKYKSHICEAIQSSATGMYKVGTIDEAIMREFDESCLISQFTPKQIKKIRQSQKVSQPVFARYLNTSKQTVQRWEAGTQVPSGVALKLLSIVEKHGLQILA